MTPEQLAQLQRETRSSVELQRSSKGDYYWTVKVYFEEGHDRDALGVIDRIDGELRTAYLPRELRSADVEATA